LLLHLSNLFYLAPAQLQHDDHLTQKKNNGKCPAIDVMPMWQNFPCDVLPVACFLLHSPVFSYLLFSPAFSCFRLNPNVVTVPLILQNLSTFLLCSTCTTISKTNKKRKLGRGRRFDGMPLWRVSHALSCLFVLYSAVFCFFLLFPAFSCSRFRLLTFWQNKLRDDLISSSREFSQLDA